MPKTEHCIDWRKTAAEIDADYTRMAEDNERLLDCMNNNQMLAAVLALPAADLITPSKIEDPIGAGTYYRANTVVRLLAAERERCAKIAPVVLTDDEIDIAWRSVDYTTYDVFRMSIGRAIESAVLRKNKETT